MGTKKNSPKQEDGSEIFTREHEILDEQTNVRGETEYLLKWEGHPVGEASWLTGFYIGDYFLDQWREKKWRSSDFDHEDEDLENTVEKNDGTANDSDEDMDPDMDEDPDDNDIYMEQEGQGVVEAPQENDLTLEASEARQGATAHSPIVIDDEEDTITVDDEPTQAEQSQSQQAQEEGGDVDSNGDAGGDGEIGERTNQQTTSENAFTPQDVEDVEMEDIEVRPSGLVSQDQGYVSNAGPVPSLMSILEHDLETDGVEPVNGQEFVGSRVQGLDAWLPDRLLK